jgi:hypothetical protein
MPQARAAGEFYSARDGFAALTAGEHAFGQ